MIKNFGRKVKSGEAWEEYKQAQADAEIAAKDAGIDLGAQRPGEGQHVKPAGDYTTHEPTRKFIKKYVLEYFLERVSLLTPYSNVNKKQFFTKKTKSLPSFFPISKHFSKLDKFAKVSSEDCFFINSLCTSFL